MGKAGKWIKSILNGGKKDKNKHNSSNHLSSVVNENSTTTIVIHPTTPKEKKRWSFRRSSTSNESTPTKTNPEKEQKKSELIVDEDDSNEKAAIKIQAVFRSHLARQALRALRGLVKLQALIRGHLVRRRATATLRCIQALVAAQARARAQRIRSAENGKLYNSNRHSAVDFRNSCYEVEKGMMEENIKTVEIDNSESKTKNNYSHYHNNERRDDRFSTHYTSDYDYIKQDYKKISPAPSAITDISPRTCSGYFENYAESLSYDYPLYPNYMANTQSSRAKARSQSAPKQRPDSFERQPSKRRPSVEGRNIPRAVRMQRSSSHLGATSQNYQYPWSIKLDKSVISQLDSECGSTCSVLTTSNYSRSGFQYDYQGNRYY